MQQPTAETTEQPGDYATRTLVIEMPKGDTSAPDPALASAELVIELPEVGTRAPDPALVGTATPRPLSRPPMRLTAGRWAAGAAALAVLAILGHQVYIMLSSRDLPFEKVPLSPAASGAATERRGTSVSGNIGRDVAVDDSSVAMIDHGVARFASPEPRSKALRAGAAVLAPSEPPRASRQATPASAASKRESLQAKSCTEAIAAVGLCWLEPRPAALAEAVAAAGTGIAPSLDRVAPKAVERAQPPPCTMHGRGRRFRAVYRQNPSNGKNEYEQ